MNLAAILKCIKDFGSKQIDFSRFLPAKLQQVTSKRYRLSTKQKIYLFRQLSYMIDSGYSIESTLYKIKGKKGTAWNKAISTMIFVIRETGSLTQALSEINAFGPEILYQVKGGELSGELANVLLEISKTFEINNGITRSLKVMMVYPAILVSILFAAIYIISTYVMPQIMELVREIDAPLSKLSMTVISISNYIAVYGRTIVLLAALSIVCFVFALKNKNVRFFFDRLLLKVYMVKDIVRMIELIRFSNVFFSLFQSGVDLETSMDCAAKAVKNHVLQMAVLHSKHLIINDGADFTEALSLSGLYDETEIQLIAIGADVSVSRLCEVIKTISVRAAQVLEAQIKALLLLIEPAMVMILGIIAGLFIVGIYSPVYAIVNSM